MRLVTNL